MVKRLLLVFLLPGALLILGCTNNVNEEATIPRTFLRTQSTEKSEQYTALYYIVDPYTESVNVLNSMDEDFEFYDLEFFEVTDETINFAYDGKGLEMTIESEYSTVDNFGNTYRMRVGIPEEDE